MLAAPPRLQTSATKAAPSSSVAPATSVAGATPLDQHPNRPSAIPGYESDLKQRVLPDLGTNRISSSDVRRLVTRLQGEGLSGSRVGTSSTWRLSANRHDETEQPVSAPQAARGERQAPARPLGCERGRAPEGTSGNGSRAVGYRALPTRSMPSWHARSAERPCSYRLAIAGRNLTGFLTGCR